MEEEEVPVHPSKKGKKKQTRPSKGSSAQYEKLTNATQWEPDNTRDAVALGSRASIVLPHLHDTEKTFFNLVATGDVDTVHQFLEANQEFNINCQNFQGVTAFHIAVQNKNDEMVDFLLSQPDIDVGDNLLHAIRENEFNIMKMIMEKEGEISPGLEYAGVSHSSDFPDHVTPLILAAQCGHYEIIEYLIERGHRITKPHKPGCICKECKTRLAEDDALHSESYRLSLYRAVSNPAYICFATPDPILTAFKLSVEIRKCATLSPQFRQAYLELEADVSNFAVDLIANCRTAEEMELVLCQPRGLQAAVHFQYPRLVLAMLYKQKGFVTHPNTQQLVRMAWVGDFHDWALKPYYFKVLIWLTRPILIPIAVIFAVVLPKHKITKFFSVPLNRMITHWSMFFIFLLLLFLISNTDKTGQKRTPPQTGIEPLIVLYIVGYLWGCIRLCAIMGPSRYFRNMWNLLDWTMCTLFLLTFFFWILSYIDVKTNNQIDLERKYWHYLDPVLLAEGTFAMGTILAYFRLLYLCRLNYYMGPLVISLGKMSADMAKYFLIFLIIIFGFSFALCRFYQYYTDMVQIDDSSGIKTQQVASFVNLRSTLKTFFWALFCMSSLESADVIIQNLPGETEGTTIINSHYFTEAVGYFCFAVFEVLTVIMILNMLVGTMCSTFQRVLDNVEVEWSFGLTDFYLEYMSQTVLPPPFNLIPTAAAIASILEFIKALIKRNSKKKAKFSPFYCCYIEREPDEVLVQQFPVLMAQLVQRYFREKDAVQDATTSEIEELKREITEMKHFLKK